MLRIITPNAISQPEGGYSRASIATYVGSDGLIKTAAVNELRVEYSPITKALLGVLMEPAGANMLAMSQDFGDAAWVKSAATVATDLAAAPDATITADKLIESATSAQHFCIQTTAAAVAAGSAVSFSVYAKAGGRAMVLQLGSTAFPSPRYAHFDPSTGLMGGVNGAGVTQSMVYIGSGWYRCNISAAAADAAGVVGGRIWITNQATVGAFIGSSVYLGDGISGIYCWGAQIEAGKATTSYIPTTTAAATRAADAVTGTYPCLVYSNAVEGSAAWDAGTSYTALNKVRLDTTRRVYQASGAVPAGSPSPDINPVWIDIGPTDRYACLDASSGTASATAGALVVGIRPGLADALALVDMSASQAAVRVYDKDNVLTYSDARRLEDTGRIVDAYSYCFSPPDLRSALVYTGIPPISSQVIWVVLSEVTRAALGTLAAGSAYNVGDVVFGAQAGIIDYSVKATDAFGNTTITKRGYAKRINLQARVAKADVDSVARKLSRERATALIWDGIDGYESGVLLGYPKEWQVEIAWPTYSNLSITVEGLA